MDAKELRQKSRQELETMAVEHRLTLRDLRRKLKTSQSAKSHELSQVKTELARILTILHQMDKTV